MQSGFRILLAEDNSINQKVVATILRHAGFQVDAVSNGVEAVAAHGSAAYDLILMDLHMPEMDGWEATWHIRASPQKQPQIIAVSADAIVGVREKCLNTGMDDYVTKPFTRDELLTAVRKAHERCTRADEICVAG
jgi:CheY-like chemotaxis protein